MVLRPDTALRLREDDSQLEVAGAALVRADVGIAMGLRAMRWHCRPPMWHGWRWRG
ncbi:hypothetical protein [Cypionkella psychrotolerans]|uniref:hypothetical protein n=1 Tax=Cypionkella psychrotolerans TaxID=1678131 RepID=UPI000A868A09|nr:hypothetical protein [Cypionkella psychrotolerans]